MPSNEFALGSLEQVHETMKVWREIVLGDGMQGRSMRMRSLEYSMLLGTGIAVGPVIERMYNLGIIAVYAHVDVETLNCRIASPSVDVPGSLLLKS